jgi:hypothetical protein
MLRIEKLSDPKSTFLKLSGWLQEEHLPLLDAEIQACQGTPKLDLDDVKLVDRSSVQFLIRRECEGIQLINCPLYIREWITRERSRPGRPTLNRKI